MSPVASAVSEPPMNEYRKTTRQIEIRVRPIYLDEHSDPDKDRYVWAYNVRISNNGGETVKLLHRRWRITDSTGAEEVIHGAGVVGEQPTLRPGESFEYTSGTPLPTPSGFMRGSYHMVNQSGEEFDLEIPAFSLDTPQSRTSLH